MADPALAQTTATYTWRNVAIEGGGGFVPGIVFNTTEQNLIYARTDIGGAYRWDQASGRWIPLLDWIGFDDWNLTGVDSIATDPVDPPACTSPPGLTPTSGRVRTARYFAQPTGVIVFYARICPSKSAATSAGSFYG